MSFKTIRQLTAAAGAGITLLPGDLIPVARSAAGVNQTLSATLSEIVKEALTDPAVQTKLGDTINVINTAAGAGPVTYTTVNPPQIGGQPIFAIPTNTDAGEHLIYEGTNGTNVVNKPFLKKALAGRGAPEVLFNQTASFISFADILSTFYRFSHTGANDHSNTTSTGEQAWTIDADGNLYQPINTQFATGFASLDTYTGYEARVIVRSSGENDAIGFVFALDQSGGSDRTLSVIRSNSKANHADGASYRYGICYNFSKNDESWLAESEVSLTANANSQSTWGSIYPNGDAFKISRSSTQIEVWIATNVATTPPDDDAAWTGYLSIDLTQAANTLPLHLSSATRLNPIPASTMAVFQGPCKWGLIARSQPACSWTELFVAQQGAAFADPATNDLVFNIETNETFQWNEATSTWDNVLGTSLGDFVDDGQALFDLGNGTFFFKQKGILQPLFSKRPDFRSTNSNFTATGGMLAQVIRMDNGVTQVGFNASYGEGWHATFLNCTGGTVTCVGGGNTTLNAGTPATTVTIPAGQSFRAFGNGLVNGAGVSILVG
jgi:hypothetical protein